jgi:hypothetical protein
LLSSVEVHSTETDLAFALTPSCSSSSIESGRPAGSPVIETVALDAAEIVFGFSEAVTVPRVVA